MKRWIHYNKDGFIIDSTKEQYGEISSTVGLIIALVGILMMLLIAKA